MKNRFIIVLILLAGVVFSSSRSDSVRAGDASPAKITAKKIVAPAPTPAVAVPLAKHTDIIYISDFSRGLDKKGIPRGKGWVLDDKKKPIDITLVDTADNPAIRFRSKNSAFGVVKEVNFDIKNFPYLNWEWKVGELPSGGDFRDKDKDDQAAQVYVSFGSLSFFNKPFVKAVGYYWSSAAPVGTEGPCPTWGKSRVIVLQSGAAKLGEWIAEKRNVYEDYAHLFEDKSPSDVSALRLYTNSQHTKTGTEVCFRNIYFSAK